MDGKHILIKPPAHSGSYYFNYKHSFSVVLLAIVDANYKFIYVDIGCNGRISDGGVFRNCDLYKELEENRLNIPQSTFIPGTNLGFPYVVIADDTFPLKQYILKPYSQTGLTRKITIFNYHLSCSHRVVENAFGILANRFRVFMTPIVLVPEKVEAIQWHAVHYTTFCDPVLKLARSILHQEVWRWKIQSLMNCDKETGITNHLQQVYFL